MNRSETEFKSPADTPKAGRRPVPVRGDFTYWRRDLARIGDVDPNNHINNVSYLDFAQSCRGDFLIETLKEAGETGTAVVVTMTVDFLANTAYPAIVDTGLRPVRLGHTSIAWKQGIFVGDTCMASMSSITVFMGQANGEPTPLPDGVRAVLTRHLNA